MWAIRLCLGEAAVRQAEELAQRAERADAALKEFKRVADTLFNILAATRLMRKMKVADVAGFDRARSELCAIRVPTWDISEEDRAWVEVVRSYISACTFKWLHLTEESVRQWADIDKIPNTTNLSAGMLQLLARSPPATCLLVKKLMYRKLYRPGEPLEQFSISFDNTGDHYVVLSHLYDCGYGRPYTVWEGDSELKWKDIQPFWEARKRRAAAVICDFMFRMAMFNPRTKTCKKRLAIEFEALRAPQPHCPNYVEEHDGREIAAALRSALEQEAETVRDAAFHHAASRPRIPSRARA